MKYIRGTRRVDPQTTVVTCQGEMDSLAVEELHQAVDPLLGDSVSHLVFDLAAVEYISSSVLSFLMASQAKAPLRARPWRSITQSNFCVRKLAILRSISGQ